MLGKSRTAVFFSMIRGSKCSKSRLAKAAGAEIPVQQRNEKWHKTLSFEAIFEVEMSKNRTPLWRKAHFIAKMNKNHIRGAIFEVQMLKNRTPLWREAHSQVKILKD